MKLFMRLPVQVRIWCYRLAYLILRIYWFTVRPTGQGVKCVLVADGRVLLVRHSYGPREWEFPGGTVKPREPPVETATREMQEELGVTINDWTELGSIEAVIQHRRDTLHCFRAEISADAVTADLGEIAAADWFRPAEFPSDLGRYVQPIFVRHRSVE